MAIWGGIEAGGTKTVCAIGSGPNDLRAHARFPTTTPDETLGEIVQFFQQYQKEGPLAGIGIASFGPVDPNPNSPTFGTITTTPKPGWAHTDLAGLVRRALDVPVGFDTDVNAAALAEHRWGAAQGLDDFVYLTVGTGIGGGSMVRGQLIYGLNHPEMGHIRIPHDWDVDPFPGSCPYHGDCLEGLAAGPALEARWGQPADTLPEDHDAWPLEAHYLAYGLVTLSCILLPQRFILGGGIMHRSQLLPLIQRKVQELLNGYLHVSPILDRIEEYIVSPGLGDQAGILGAIALAQEAKNQTTAWENSKSRSAG
jgi:fructokinase